MGHDEDVDKETITNQSDVAFTADVGGGRCDCRRNIVSCGGQEPFKEDPRVHLESCTVVFALMPPTGAPGERYCRGAQNEKNKHPGLYGVHHANAIAAVGAGEIDARGYGITARGNESAQ